jgi:recombination protein RecT
MSQHNLQTASNEQPIDNKWHYAIEAAKEKFTGSSLDFLQEQIFATQLLMNNSYLLTVAKNNPSSLRLAMYNVAAVGLSLNPNQGLAYLVPRRLNRNEEPKVMLDISYRGLISIGVETGAILCAKSEIVHENDTHFAYKGAFQKPEHTFDPFLSPEDRGQVRGGYCIAELPSGGVIVEAMSKSDMDKIKKTSEAFKKGFGPWIDWEDQMQLKTVTKRASKWWPISSPRLAKALQILHEENGEGLAVLAKDARSVGILPPPPARHDVHPATQNSVKQLVTRAVAARAFEACKELMESRYKDPSELSFALSELENAKANSDLSDDLQAASSN